MNSALAHIGSIVNPSPFAFSAHYQHHHQYLHLPSLGRISRTAKVTPAGVILSFNHKAQVVLRSKMASEAQTKPETSLPASDLNGDSSQPSVGAESKFSRPDDPQERLARWVDGWAKPRDAPGRIAFHKADPNINLLKNLDKFLEPEQEGGEKRRVLVPLCGKTVDMPFLSSKVSGLMLSKSLLFFVLQGPSWLAYSGRWGVV